MNQLQGVPVAPYFLLVPVAERGLPEHERADAGLVHLDTFDPIGRHGTFDQGMFAEQVEFLGRLARVQVLSAPRLGEIGQIPGRPRGQRGRLGGE